MSETLRVGVVGAGIGAGYIAGFQKQSNVEVVALCARTRARMEPLAERYHILHLYTDYDEMLAREPMDIVVVATPNYLHHAMTLAALNANKHVICDKPLAMNVAQAQEMLDCANARGRKHFMPFVFRFLPAAQYMKEIIDVGFLGQVFHVNVRYYVHGWGDMFGPMRWQYDREQAGTGTLGNIGSHMIHLIHWWLGDIRRVSAMMSTAVRERKWHDGTVVPIYVDDVCAFIGELDNGAPIVFNTSSVSLVARARVEIDIFGSEGALTFQQDWGKEYSLTGNIIALRRNDQVPSPVEIPARLKGEFTDMPDYYTPMRTNFVRMTSEFVGAIREDRPAAPNFHDGVRVQHVMDAVCKSVETQSWVEV
ncbi:MAG TPA: Gfo/Idh/MocA family oxidoreductase [Anaerolineae bacterium]|nr:Gfo/Idh/MocA family oxidoreductase [Anaerolineae bacterium]